MAGHKLLACIMHCFFMQHHTWPGPPGYLVRSQKVHYGKAGVQDKRAPLKRQRIRGAKLKQINSCCLPPKCILTGQRGALQLQDGQRGSYLPVDVMHWDVHKDGSLCKPFQVNVSVTCCWRTKGRGIRFTNESRKENIWQTDCVRMTAKTPRSQDVFTQSINDGILATDASMKINKVGMIA